MLKVWNVALAIGAFTLSIFGTFLTRSGIISSVHAFAESAMGPLLIGFTFLTVAVGTGLIVWRLPALRASGRIGSVVSREAAFLLTNLLFVAMTIVVMWGTVYPIVSKAVRGIEVSVGPSFFQALMAPLTIILIALVGACPLLAWRRVTGKHLKRNFSVPLTVGAVTFGMLAALNRGRNLLVVLVLAIGAYVLTTVTMEIYRGLNARHQHHGETWPRAVLNLFAFTPRRYGGPIIHAGIVVMIAGIAFNIGLKQQTEQQLTVGQSLRLAGYTVTFGDLTFEQTPVRFSLIGTFPVTGPNGEDLGTIRSDQAEYEGQQRVTEVGMRSTFGSDLYVVMSNVDPTQRLATVLVFYEPAVFWIWTGMVIVVLGGILAAWPWRTDRASRSGIEELDELPSAFEEPEVAR